MKLPTPLLRLLPALALLAAGASHATDYTVTTLPGNSATQGVQVFGLNNAGQVAGGFITLGGTPGQQAFVWQADGTTFLTGPAGALGSTALGIADNGVVVGSWYDSLVDDGTGTGNLTFGNVRGFVLDGGVYTTVAAPGASFTQLRGVSPDGQLVTGYATVGDVNVGFVHDRSSGSFTYLGVTDSLFTLPQGMNSAGLVTGSDVIQPAAGPGTRPGFVHNLASGTRTDTLVPGWQRTAFRDIDESGGLVGWLSGTDASGAPLTVGFIGSPAAFETFSIAGSANTTLQANNDFGWIAGNYTLDGVNYAFVATPVPEPAAGLMLALGAAALLLARRRH
jgi:uncharacterized membrane protein